MEKAEHIDKIKKEYTPESINNILSQFKKIKALVIGDAIIDEYNFTVPKGRAAKDPILSVDYVKHETYAGGALAIANHVSNFVGETTCVTALGDMEAKKDFIMGALNKNVATKFFIKENSPTTIKKRYLNILRNEKLFKIEYINEQPISEELEKEVMNYLNIELKKYDIVIVGDFGHGFITDNIIKTLKERSKFIAVNAQSNSANLGFNFITKYNAPDYATMDVPELQYAVGDRFSSVPILMDKFHHKSNFNKFLVTLGKNGSAYFNAGQQAFFPAFVTRPQDTVGAGDAVFSVTSLFAYCNYNEIIPFIANCVGGIAVSYMGNREFITKERLLNFIQKAYNGDMEIN